MSVQLIVYPQSYNGFYNAMSSSPSEVIVNGISFTNLDNSTSYDSSDTVNIPLDVLINEPPTIVNTWYRFRGIGSGTPNLPVVLAGDLVLNSTTTQTLSGIYQKLSNLTIGSQYTFTIDVSTPASDGFILLSAFNGTNLITSTIFSATLSQITHTFTAASTDDTIMISYSNNASNSVTISNASIQPVIGAVPSGATNFLDNGQVICDLYEDEDLPLTLSVDDFKNVAEKVQSYSKAFNLPSTKRNNRIFDQVFEITRVNDGIIFNPYKRTQCVLKQDGFILFQGFLRLLDVTDKEGEISYNVNLYSEVVALADTLKDRTFSDLGFSELAHDYNYTNIVLSETGNLILTNPLPVGSFAGAAGATITNVIRYPFVNWNNQYAFTTGGMPKLLTLESSYRPFINIKYLIQNIFAATDFTFSSTFFDTSDFGRLYMDFNWGGDDLSSLFSDSGTGYLTSNQIATQSYTTVLTNNNTFPSNAGYSSGVFSPVNDGTTYNINYSHIISNSVAISAFFIRWVMVKDGVTSTINQESQILTDPGIAVYSGSINEILNIGDTLHLEFLTTIPSATTIIASGTSSSNETIVVVSGIATSNNTLSQTLRGELGQWDFLKGLMTMFNLVTLVDEDNPNNIIIEPYSDIFIPTATGGTTLADRGVEHDWTDKIDISQIKLEPLTELNKTTIFKFVEDDDDYAFNQYKNLVGGHLYGSNKYNAGDEFNILDGEDEIVAEPFAATVVKPLMSQFSDFIVPSIYANGGDGVWEGFENSPRIMYSNGQKTLNSDTFSVPAQNGSPANASADTFLQFSHLSTIPTTSATLDFHFGICQLMPGVGASSVNNLFNRYWLPYYSELYNPNTRTMTMKVDLSPSDINTFRFNDTIFIKNRVFRVNKIDYKPNDLATVEFILIP